MGRRKKYENYEKLLFIGDILQGTCTGNLVIIKRIEFGMAWFGEPFCGYILQPLNAKRKPRRLKEAPDPYFISQNLEDETLEDLYKVWNYRLHTPSIEHLFHCKARVNNKNFEL